MKKSGSFFEQHIDKIVLGAIGLASLAILFAMVIRSPNTVTVGAQSVGPADIDAQIMSLARRLNEEVINQPPVPKTYAGNLDEFTRLFASGATGINVAKRLPIPDFTPAERITVTGPFVEPPMPSLTRPVAGLMRGVAQIPVAGTGTSRTGSAQTEPEDVDLVTVQSSFNPTRLYRDMENNFRGAPTEVQIPVFAAVELQRQVMNEDGTWNEQWQIVRRTRIDPYAELLNPAALREKTIADADVLRSQLSTSEVTLNLLQPMAYNFMDRQDPWLPPELEQENETLKMRAGMMAPAASPAPTGRQAPQQTRPGMSPDETDTRTTSRTRPAPTRPQPAPARPSPQLPTTLTPVQKFQELTLVSRAQIPQKDSIVFWAHDDRVEPGNTYRYRLRLGILNPIAGRGSSTVDPELSEKLVFWTEFTSPTGTVEVPDHMYLFPQRITDDNAVTVEVAVYELGRWNRKAYEVRPGETIGRVERQQPVFTGSAMIELPDVDYTTGATFVDVEEVTDYRPGTTIERQYMQMLYEDADGQMRDLPIGRSNWPSSLSARYSEIDRAIRTQGDPVIRPGVGEQRAPSAPTGVDYGDYEYEE